MKKVISRISLAAKTDFVKVSAWSGVSTAVKMLTGLISIKVVSTIVGPAGIAMIGQFLNGITMVSMLATGGIGQGVTKYIAEYYDEPQKQRDTIFHAVWVTLGFTALMSLLVILFSSQLTIYIFKTSQYRSLVILFGISVGLYSFNTLLVSILNGFKAFKKFVLVNIISSVFGLAVTLLLVTQFGLYGALLNCILAQSVIILVTLFFIYKEPWFLTLFNKSRFDFGTVKKLAGFSIMALTSAIIVPFSQLNIRSFIASRLSVHDAGIWEGINRLSGMYLLLVTTSIGIYYLPRLSEIKDSNLLRAEIYKTAKIVLPALGFAFLLIFILRDILIWMVFSDAFMPMRDLFVFQLVGDFFRVASSLLAFLFWAKGMTKAYIICEVIFNLTLIILVRNGVSYFGLQGSVYAYAATYLLYLLIMIFIFRHILFNYTSEKQPSKG